MRAVRRFFCGLGGHRSAAGDALLTWRVEVIPEGYRVQTLAPPEIVQRICGHCGAVVTGLTVAQLLRMRESPWDL